LRSALPCCSYHINSSSELAQRFNDQSVMENHHCAITFAILRHKDCNILEQMPQVRLLLREPRKAAAAAADGLRPELLDCALRKQSLRLAWHGSSRR
jgi:hypothetical protein